MLEVRTGCRLHFGLMELFERSPLRFAGLGLMLTDPGFVLSFSVRDQQPGPNAGTTASTIRVAPTTQATAEISRRIQQVLELRRSLDSAQGNDLCDHCHIEVLRALPLHSGLGAGTQLACAVAAGLELYERFRPRTCGSGFHTEQRSSPPAWSPWQPLSELRPTLTTRWLVRQAGRGLRSAVGLTGFLYGGLVLDKGYCTQPIPHLAERPLTARSTFLPEPWRVVLIAPTDQPQIHGGHEAQLMERLGARPNPQRGQMLQLAERICQSAQSDDTFTDFVDALEPYMELGARLFSDYQQGLYNGAEIAAAVEQARAAGLRGVGQSSWGPTVFGFTPEAVHAAEIAQRLSAHRPDWKVTITKPATSGAAVRWLI